MCREMVENYFKKLKTNRAFGVCVWGENRDALTGYQKNFLTMKSVKHWNRFPR